MLKLNLEELCRYLSSIHNKPVKILSVGQLLAADWESGKELKAFGYGEPILIEYEVEGRKEKAVGSRRDNGRMLAPALWRRSAFRSEVCCGH